MIMSQVRNILLAITLALFAGQAAAEQIEIYGVTVPVEELAAVDASHLKIKLFGEVDFVKRSGAELHVLDGYLGNINGAKALGKDVWRRIFEAAQKAGNQKSAAASFLLYSLISGEAGSLDEHYLESVFLGKDDSSDLAKEILLIKRSDQLDLKVRSYVMLAAGLKHTNWLRANYLSKLLANNEFRVFAESRFAESLKLRNLGLARKIAGLLDSVYIGRDDRYKKFQLATDLIAEFEGQKGEVSNNPLLTLLSLRNTDESMRPVLDPFLIDGFHTLAENALKRGKFEEALTVLSSISPDHATPTTFELLKRILKAIQPSSQAFSNDTVRRLLRSATAKDRETKVLVENLLFQRAMGLLSAHNFADASLAALDLKEVSPDSSLNEKLKVESAVGYLRAKNKRDAERILETRESSLGLYDRARLFMEGYYGEPLMYVLIIMIPLIVKLAYEFFTRPLSSRPSRRENVMQAPVGDSLNQSGDFEAAQFINTRMSQRGNPLVDEYEECLAVFKLRKGVDTKGIKTAYRTAVRKIHPDLNAGQQAPEDAQRFVELTRTYDRLRELHRLLGLER